MPHAEAPEQPEVEPVLVTLQFDAHQPDALLSLLARYVVITRTHPGCRNVDLVASVTTPSRFTVIQKWSSVDDQRRHFDSQDMVALATGCEGLLAAAPVIDLHEPISMHDLA